MYSGSCDDLPGRDEFERFEARDADERGNDDDLETVGANREFGGIGAAELDLVQPVSDLLAYSGQGDLAAKRR